MPPPTSAPPRDTEPRHRTRRARGDAGLADRGGSDGTAASTIDGAGGRPLVGGFHLRLRDGDASGGGRRERWSAAAAATALTSGAVALLIIGLARALTVPAPAPREPALSPAEALRWVAVPAPGATGAAEDAMSAPPPPAYTSARVPPLFAAPRDTGASRSVRGAVGPRRGAPPPAIVDPRLQPAPNALPERLPALAPGTLVLPGRLHACADGLCAEEPGASGESGVMRRTNAPLTDARRDSLLRVMEDRIARATRMANENRPSNGTPPAGDNGGFGPTQQTGGSSISIGLPGGGPSAAERRRDSTAHAAGRRQIGRLDARADSLRRDSVRRDSVRRDSVRRATAGPRRAPE